MIVNLSLFEVRRYYVQSAISYSRVSKYSMVACNDTWCDAGVFEAYRYYSSTVFFGALVDVAAQPCSEMSIRGLNTLFTSRY